MGIEYLLILSIPLAANRLHSPHSRSIRQSTTHPKRGMRRLGAMSVFRVRWLSRRIRQCQKIAFASTCGARKVRPRHGPCGQCTFSSMAEGSSRERRLFGGWWGPTLQRLQTQSSSQSITDWGRSVCTLTLPSRTSPGLTPHFRRVPCD